MLLLLLQGFFDHCTPAWPWQRGRQGSLNPAILLRATLSWSCRKNLTGQAEQKWQFCCEQHGIPSWKLSSEQLTSIQFQVLHVPRDIHVGCFWTMPLSLHCGVCATTDIWLPLKQWAAQWCLFLAVLRSMRFPLAGFPATAKQRETPERFGIF